MHGTNETIVQGTEMQDSKQATKQQICVKVSKQKCMQAYFESVWIKVPGKKENQELQNKQVQSLETKQVNCTNTYTKQGKKESKWSARLQDSKKASKQIATMPVQ